MAHDGGGGPAGSGDGAVLAVAGPRLRVGVSRPAALLRDLLSGAVVSGIFFAYCISFSALIFTGPLAPGLPLGLNAILLGAAVSGVIVGLFSSLPRAVGGPDTPSIAVFSVLAVSVTADLPGDPTAAVLRVLTAISVTTLLTGLMLFFLGSWRLGWLARFVPYSVVAGFLAASGCLLIGGAFHMATGVAPDGAGLTAVFDGATVAGGDGAMAGKLLVAVLLAGAVFVIRLWIRNFFVLPAVVAIGVALCHGGLAAAGLTVDQARDLGWFLPSLSGASLVMPLGDGNLLVDAWSSLVASFGEVVVVAVVTTMAVILNTSGLEAAWKTNANLNREFRIAGMANMLAGALGGIAGNISLNRSLLNSECGAAGRLSAVIPGLACLSLLVFHTPILDAFPTPVLAGLLLFLGLAILVGVVGASRHGGVELVQILLVAGVILLVGYLEGLFVGLIGACSMFAYTYSRVDIIKHELTRRDRASTVDRPPEPTRFLIDKGDLIRMVELQGYLFFATSNRLAEHLRSRIQRNGRTLVDYLIVDFRLVTGLDISTALSFAKLRNTCEEIGVKLVLCAMSPQVARVIVESKQDIVDGVVVREFPSLDEGLDWAEESLLQARGATLHVDEDFNAWLRKQVGDADIEAQILPYMERLEFRGGDRLVAQGAASDSIDLVASGRVRVMLEIPGVPAIRLRSMLGHTELGEMGFYRRRARGASVVAEEPTVVYRLGRGAFARMARDNPDAAAAFHQFIIRVLADRLDFANAAIASLER